MNVIASDYSLSTTNTVTVTSTSSPDARTYTPEVIPDNSDPGKIFVFSFTETGASLFIVVHQCQEIFKETWI